MTGNDVAFALMIVTLLMAMPCALYLVGGADAVKAGTLMLAMLLIAIAATVRIATWLGWGPK